ncbi:MAG: thermonuclease family protein [bacterium]|nr:thermonuclease family protein [bacterium]
MNLFVSRKFMIVAGVVAALLIGVVIYGESYRTIGGGFRSDTLVAPAGNLAAGVAEVTVLKNKSGDGLVSPARDRSSDTEWSETLNWTQTQTSVISNEVSVVRVIDGDTIEIEGGERVRYIGIDTPETVDPREPVQCFGVEASDKNKELVYGVKVRLTKDVTEKDKYGRLLRYVWVGDTLINLELVKQGFAYSYSYPPDVKYQDLFVKAQAEAREAKRGLWSSCSAGAPIQTEATAPQEASSDGSCVIKGNISSSGEKIYHILGCGSYEKTRIDEARGERWFCSESEALVAGWRKASNCQ